MVKPTPTRFNPDLLARDSTQYRVELPLVQFTRLRTLLLEPTGSMVATCRFARQKKFVKIAGTLSADFTLECQRCLEPMTHSFTEPFELVFVSDEAAAQAMPESFDPVVLDDNGQIHVVDLFEDELILQLPTAARHVQSDSCFLVDAGTDDTEVTDTKTDNNSEVEPARKRNPFDVLKNLDLH